MSNSSFVQEFIDKVDSGGNVIWINLIGDEGRAERTLAHVAKVMSKSGAPIAVMCWDLVHGAEWDATCENPVKAMQAIQEKVPGNALVVMRDLHLLLNAQANVAIRRTLAELCKTNSLSNKDHTRPIVILADTPNPHPDIKDFCDIIDFDLPSYSEMRTDVVDWIRNSIRENNTDVDTSVDMSDADAEKVTHALLGMTGEEAQRVLSTAATALGGLNRIKDTQCPTCHGDKPAVRTCSKCGGTGVLPGVLSVISREKAKVIRKIEGLTFIPHAAVAKQGDIGGYDGFLDFLRKRSRAYSTHAQEIDMPRPRGAVLIGPPGTGKTMVAKAAASILELDLILMDIGSMYDSLVGSSEKRIRTALATISAMKNCFLMVDEIDKALAGSHQNSSSDGGVSSRILSYFLTWLSERDMRADDDNRAFVMITANRVTGLPPEMLRAGRFDRVFSTDLPDGTGREEILNIHLRQHGIDASRYAKSLRGVVQQTDEYSGAELAEVVNSARFEAFDARMAAWEANNNEGDPPTAEDCWPTVDELLAATADVVPLAKLNSEAITEIRKFCEERATPVSGRRVPLPAGSRKSRGVRTSRGSDPANN